MFSRLKELYCLLSEEQRKRFTGLQFFVVLMAFGEVAGVASIGPFMALVGDMSLLEGEGILAQLYQITGFEDPADFLLWVGISVLILLTTSAAISMATTWRLALYANQVGAELSTRLYKYYMSQSWLFHASGSSSQLTNKLAQECGRVTNQIINPLMQLNARVVMAVVMVTAIFIFNPLVALVGVTLFVSVYVVLYRTVRRALAKNGRVVTDMSRQRFKLMNEGFGGIKDTMLLGRQGYFNQRYEATSRAFGRAQGTNQGMTQVPRFAMELLAFSAVIFLVLYLLAAHEGDLGTILPMLSIYALAGLKLLPAFQNIYTGFSQVKANLPAFESVKEDLKASQHQTFDPQSGHTNRLTPKLEVGLDNVVFRYPNKAEAALNGLSLTVPVNHVVGLVGASGAGKSTVIDILLGLIEPEQGKLTIDGEPLQSSKKRAWQNSLGFVPQSIFLADASIRENIAFGIPEESINDDKVERAARMAHLEDLLGRLPDGLETRVGERGVQLSGGQRQRIGIARALYDDANILILDEATSALDGITERLVMDAIHDFSRKKTIIMIAHRLATVKKCDCIYFMEEGRVTDKGTYDELAQRNAMFRRMAENA